jgi:hypothetical protein
MFTKFSRCRTGCEQVLILPTHQVSREFPYFASVIQPYLATHCLHWDSLAEPQDASFLLKGLRKSTLSGEIG